jgi:hypothetical protein
MIKIFEDTRGKLVPLDFSNLIFNPKRVFSVFDVPKNEIRGNHAHFNTIQFIICLKGEILVGLDYSNKKEQIKLLPGDSILIDKLIWGWQQFLTGDEYMLVLCSTFYDANDYILDKDEFCRLKNNNI